MTGRLTEKTFMRTVTDVCRIHGYEVFHTYDSRRSTPGFPDLEIIGHGRIFHRELKLDHGRTTPAQDACIDLINRNGGDAEIVSDLQAARMKPSQTMAVAAGATLEGVSDGDILEAALAGIQEGRKTNGDGR